MTTDFRYEIDESEDRFKLEGLTDANASLLWLKHLTLYEEYARFWQPRLEMGRKCSRYERRVIFTDTQRDYYKNTLGKIPVEPQEVKPIINALMKQILLRVPDGTISMEDANPPETAAQPEVVRVVLQWLKGRLKVDKKRRNLLRRGLVVGMPQCLWFDLVSKQGGLSTELQATLLPWQGTLPSPLFRDSEEIEDVVYADLRSKAVLLDAFPDREAALDRHTAALKRDPKHYITLLQNQNNLTSKDRSTLLYNLVEQARYDSLNGLYFTIQHTFPIETKRTIYFNENTEHAIQIPGVWPEWRKQAWIAANPDYEEIQNQPVKTLWVTIFDQSGFIWYNGPSWYQYEAQLPCAWFLPSLVDEQPTGAVEDMLPYVFARAVSETEGLDQVRKGTGSVTFVREGAVRHPKFLGQELNKPDGVVLLKKNANPDQDVKWKERKPNTTFLEYSDRQKEQLADMHHVSAALLGVFGGRQSDRAKQREQDAAMGPQAEYVENFSEFGFQLDEKLCSFFPYALNEYRIVEIEDEWGHRETAEVNVEGFDNQGQGQIVANDLTSVKYRVEPVPGDDSKLSREEQMREFVQMLEAFGNTLLQMQPTYFANVMMSFPNRYAREMGRFMGEAAQQQSQLQAAEAANEQELERMRQQTRTVIELIKVITPRLMLKTDATDIAEAPEGFRLFYQWAMSQQERAAAIAASSQAMGQPQQAGPQQGQPQQQPVAAQP